MLTINVNGVKLEAETMKELNKLVKKEEKRQLEAQKERNIKKTIAGERAWSSYGKLAYKVSCDRPNLWFVEPTKEKINPYEYTIKIERADSDHGNLQFGYGYTIETTIMSIEGTTLAIRSLSNPAIVGKEEIAWFATGSYQGETDYHWIDEHVAAKLEAEYQQYLFNKQAA